MCTYHMYIYIIIYVYTTYMILLYTPGNPKELWKIAHGFIYSKW